MTFSLHGPSLVGGNGSERTALVKYDAARHALAEAHRVDEAKEIRDKAVAVAAYARQVNDRDMIRMATEIKLRAERRMGELLREMEKQHGARGNPGPGRGKKNGVVKHDSVLPTLKSLGITKQQSADAQQLAAIPSEEFEQRLSEVAAGARGITTEAMLRRRQPPPDEDFIGEERIWDATRLWLYDAAKLPAIEELKAIRPRFGVEMLSEHYQRARAYMDGLAKLAGEGYL